MLLLLIVLTDIITIPNNLVFMYEDKRESFNRWRGYKQTVTAGQYDRQRS